MEKRLYFKCWNCGKKYSLFKGIAGEQELIVACPFCNQEGVVDLEPYKKKKIELMRSLTSQLQTVSVEGQSPDWVFPEVIPTQKKD